MELGSAASMTQWVLTFIVPIYSKGTGIYLFYLTIPKEAIRGHDKNSGLGTAFFSVLNASFFCVLLKNATFF